MQINTVAFNALGGFRGSLALVLLQLVVGFLVSRSLRRPPTEQEDLWYSVNFFSFTHL